VKARAKVAPKGTAQVVVVLERKILDLAMVAMAKSQCLAVVAALIQLLGNLALFVKCAHTEIGKQQKRNHNLRIVAGL